MYYKLRRFLREEFHSWHESDFELLVQTCRWAQRASTARSGLVDGDGKPALTATGYKGQPVQHPNLRSAMEAEKAFIEGLKELGFTPMARKRNDIHISDPVSKFGL